MSVILAQSYTPCYCFSVKTRDIILILYNIRSAHNVGALFRTADGAGVSKIYLIGVTPAPINRFGNIQKEIAKTALGAEMVVKWESKKHIAPIIKMLKQHDYLIVALEQAADSFDYRALEASKKVALIAGAERGGIPESVLTQCDKIIHIPLKGMKNSLNVATATGIALFSLVK